MTSQSELLVAVSVALAIGLMQNWLPAEQIKSLQLPAEGSQQDKPKQEKKDKPGDKPNQGGKVFNMTNDSNADFKKALEVGKHRVFNFKKS